MPNQGRRRLAQCCEQTVEHGRLIDRADNGNCIPQRHLGDTPLLFAEGQSGKGICRAPATMHQALQTNPVSGPALAQAEKLAAVSGDDLPRTPSGETHQV